MMTRTIKRKLLKAKITLNQTIQSILNINRTRKQLSFLSSRKAEAKELTLEEELKVLNRLAAQQAKLVQHYEHTLATVPFQKEKPLPGDRKRFWAA
ncbi:MAG: hypothetical protein IPH16_17740 [Haliscomenobacter sp.]|nr:hypothetical protein [Haliscomenobacter sp.]MBK7476889.1 hypothetical protein [Haliscomenobacter sp.]MBK8879970.1 hypothetical protein [Haliscomenobacter sp.]